MNKIVRHLVQGTALFVGSVALIRCFMDYLQPRDNRVAVRIEHTDVWAVRHKEVKW